MVHRPADSRLLTNLLQQEKEYSKQLGQVLESSNASLASVTAYAAASPPPASHVIMAIAGSLAAADEALRRYAHGVDEWRDTMKLLKDTEDEVGNIMRDREILVTRLIKASKSQKSGTANVRESLLSGNNQRFPSSSSLSLSVGHGESSPSRPMSSSFSSSTKLAAAQSELQACETHLAAKERELVLKRCAAVRDGLGARMTALIECGWAWGEIGKEALNILEELKIENLEHQSSNRPLIHEPHFKSLPEHILTASEPNLNRPSSDFSSIAPSQSASQVNGSKDPPPVRPGSLEDPVLDLAGNNETSNDNENIQIHPQAMTRILSQSGTRPESGASETTGSSIYYSPATPATYKVETVTYAPAVALHLPARDASTSSFATYTPYGNVVSGGSPQKPPATSELFKDDSLVHATVRIPAPHALDDGFAYAIPTADMPVIEPSGSGFASGSGSAQQHHRRPSLLVTKTGTSSPQASSTPPRNSTALTAVAPGTPVGAAPQLVSATAPQPAQRHVLERRITEEEIRRADSADLNHGQELDDEAGSSTEEDVKAEKQLVKEGNLVVVENPRFLSEEKRKELEREQLEKNNKEEPKEKEKEKKRFSFFHPHHGHGEHSIPEPLASAPPNGHVTSIRQSEERQQQASTSKAVASPSKSASASPSKGFLGSLRGFFGAKQAQPQSPSVPSRSVHDTADSDSDDEHPSPSVARLSNAGGLQNLFRGKAKEKEKTSDGWETRTEKNVRNLARTGSLDQDGSNRGGGVGLGIAGSIVANAGVANAAGIGSKTGLGKGRSASDVDVTTPVVASSPGGRRLKKPRGPPISASAAASTVIASGGGVGGDSGSVLSTASSEGNEQLPPPRRSIIKTPARAASTSTPGDKTKSMSPPTRRSASVDVDVGKRKSWVDEGEDLSMGSGDGMIVDLGRRRRTASEAGKMKKKMAEESISAPPLEASSSGAVPSAGGPAKLTHAGMKVTATPMKSVATVNRTKGYSSDTAAVAASAATVTRKKSLTKKRAQVNAAEPVPVMPPLPPVIGAAKQTILGSPISAAAPIQRTPSRKSSTKTTASATSPHHHSNPSSTSLATILPAGGDNPSGNLVPQSGWSAQAQAPGGSLFRNSSISNMPSGSAGGGATKGKKHSTLGQGIGGSGAKARRLSANGQSQPSGRVDSNVSSSAVVSSGTGASGNGSVVQPASSIPTLMSIVEGVARNREGWGQDPKVWKSVGGTQKPSGMIDLVKAPPSVSRETLAAFDSSQIVKSRSTKGKAMVAAASSSSTSLSTAIKPSPKTAMLEVKAPGSVFDARPTIAVSPAEASLSGRALHQDEVWATGINTNPGQPPFANSHRGLQPLRSALRNTSRSPSPQPVAGPSRISHEEVKSIPKLDLAAPSPVEGALPWGTDGTLHQPLPSISRKDKKGKGKAPDRPTSEDPHETSDTSNYETGNEYYSGQDEVEESAVRAAPAPAPSIPTSNHPNGHPVVYGSPKGASELSQSTTSTAMAGHSGASTSSDAQTRVPRRRKSVRVSLQPTFSPSPPAIEYDYEEEQRQYAPWGRQNDRQEERSVDQPPPLSASIPVRAEPPAREKTVLDPPDKVRDMWVDSDSEEDKEYAKAKKLLKRAAKREKDVNLLVANRV